MIESKSTATLGSQLTPRRRPLPSGSGYSPHVVTQPRRRLSPASLTRHRRRLHEQQLLDVAQVHGRGDDRRPHLPVLRLVWPATPNATPASRELARSTIPPTALSGLVSRVTVAVCAVTDDTRP